MKKVTTFLFAILIGLATLTDALAQSRFSLAPTVSAGYQDMNYNFHIPGSRSEWDLSGSGVSQSITAGLQAHYALTSHWSFSVGLLYNRVKGEEKYSYPAGGPPSSTQTIARESVQLPLLVNYRVTNRRLSPYLSAGILFNYEYQGSYTNPVTGAITHARTPISRSGAIYPQAMVGLGIQYQFSPKISLIVQPTATYRLDQPSEYYTTFRIYNLGLQTQVKFSF